LTTDTELPARLLVPINDACKTLGGITRPTIYRLINARELDRVKIGTRSFVTVESLRDFVDRKMRQSAKELDAEIAAEAEAGT
jgi:predicted DNA-binding transcriptional regulator AlpA